MITDEQLKAAAQELDDAIMAALPEPLDDEFSPRFQRKMKKLIHRTKHTHHFNWGRCVAAIFVAVLLLSGAVLLSEFTIKADFSGLFDELVHGSYRYYLNTDIDENTPRDYRLTIIPEGYELNFTRVVGPNTMVRYTSDTDKRSILFSYVINCSDSGISFGDEIKHSETWIHGESADLFTYPNTGHRTIVWLNEDRTVLFKISGLFSEEELVCFAESMVPYELE